MAMNPGTIQLLNPLYLWLLPVLFVAEQLWRQWSSAPATLDLRALEPASQTYIVHPLTHLLPRSRSKSVSPYFIRGFVWLILTVLIVALGQPVRVEKKLPDRMEQRDITFIVDTSLSMTLRDYELDGQRVERIHLLKSLLKKFVSQLRDDRIGILVFGETAQTLVPLTKDQTLLRNMIDRISAGMIGRHNAIGDSIALAVREVQQQKDNKRILVLLTDAGTHTGKIDPLAAAQLAAESGISLYIVAIGATTSDAKERTDASGLLFQTVEMPVLNSLATITSRKSYLASASKAINNAISDITHQDSNTIVGKPKYAVTQLYPWLLGVALLSLGILPLLGWRQA